MPSFSIAVSRICVLLLLCFAVDSAHGSSEGKMKKVAQSLAKELRELQIDTVRVKVEDLDALASSLPNMIREVLVSEFKSCGITVAKETAARTLKIRPTINLEDGTDTYGQVSLDFVLVDGLGKELRVLAVECDISDPVDIVPVLGLNVDGSNTKTGKSRPVGPDKALPKADGKNPDAIPYVENKAIRGHKDGMFALQILKGGTPLDIQANDSNFAFCPLADGDEYQVKIINDAVFPVLVALTIDGLDSGWFSPQKKVLWYVPEKSSSVIEGWIKSVGDNGNGGRFKVAPEDESVAAAYGKLGDVGVVQASFFRAYLPGEFGDPIAYSERGKTDEYPWKPVGTNKIPGAALRASISVRYSKTQ